MKWKTTALVALAGVSGFAQAGDVTPMGENLYSLSKTAAGCGFAGTGGIKSKAYKEAGEFCGKKTLLPEIANIQEQDGVIGRRCARVTIEFRCVKSVGENTTPTGRAPDRDMNHAPEIAADRGQFGTAGKQQIQVQTDDKYDRLLKLKQLLDAGAITTAEFDAEKAKILAQ